MGAIIAVTDLLLCLLDFLATGRINCRLVGSRSRSMVGGTPSTLAGTITDGRFCSANRDAVSCMVDTPGKCGPNPVVLGVLESNNRGALVVVVTLAVATCTPDTSEACGPKFVLRTLEAESKRRRVLKAIESRSDAVSSSLRCSFIRKQYLGVLRHRVSHL